MTAIFLSAYFPIQLQNILVVLSSVVYFQVSVIVLPDYKPPLAACAMNEVLEWVSS
jgi:hypothetical protein